MKKKRIFISLALIASFSLASCDNDNTGSVTIDRGTTDASPSTIVLPEEVVGTGSTNPSGIDPVEVEPIDAPTNSYESKIVGEYKLLQANSGIGYKFLGWYNGDKLISTSDSFKVLLSEADYITPKFELAPGFEYLEFTSTDTECVVTGLKEGCPIDFTLPEGITEIASGAFEYANICFLTLPKSLKKIGDFAFSNSGIVRVTFNSVPEMGEDLFSKVMSIGSGGLLPIGYIGMVSDPVDYSNVPSHQYQNDLDLEVFMNVDTAEITENFANAMQNICTPIESLADSCYSLIDDYLFEIYEGGVRLDRYYGEDTNLVLPDGTDDLTSYSIYDYAIPTNAESVKFSKKVDWICDNAFYNCYNLKTVELNEGLEGIGYDSFYYCTSLEEITIPSTVEEIDSSAFYNCSSLYTIYNYSNLEMTIYSAYGANPIEIITDKNTTSQVGIKGDFRYYIDKENNTVTLLNYLGNSKDVTIPTFDDYSIVISSELFRYNEDIETVKLNDKVISIGSSAFEGCENLKSITDTKNIKEIGYSAFNSCKNLQSIDLENVETIGSSAFAYCCKLKSVVFSNVININSSAFRNCYILSQIILPKTLETIESDAFNYCYNLVEVINKSSLSISKGSYSNGSVACYAKNVVTDEAETKFKEENGLIYYNDEGNKILYEVKDKSTKKLVINNDYYSIACGALSGLQLEELELHVMDNYLSYYFGATYYDYSTEYLPNTITKITLGKEITAIPDYAFYECSSLKEINIPNTITSIGNYAFYETGLKKIDLNEGINYVGYSLFYNCKSLTSVVLPSTLTVIGESMFEGCSSLQSVKISEGTTAIYSEAFKDCKSLYTVVIPSTITEIQYSAFENCTTLETISLKNTNVTSLPSSLFSNCKNLVNLELPDTLTSINSTTFSGCDKLEGTVYKNGCYFGTADNPYRWLVKARTKTILECTIHPDCEKIYDGAFSSCYKLKKVVVPSTCTDFSYFLSGVTTLEYLELPYHDSSSVFSRLTGLSNDSIKNLKELVINGGTTIADKAFQNYTNLKSITLSSDITTIGKNAFEGTGLETFVASSNLSKINLQAFKDCTSLTSVDLTNMSISTYSFSDGSNNSASTFEGCTSLTNVLLPTNLGGVASRMFYGCSALESITFPDKTTLVGTQAFAKTSIKSITWNKVTEVLKGAFYGTDIETITIPSGMKIQHGTSGYGVFENCKNLKTVIWNTNIINSYNGGKYAFRNCTSLASFTMNSGQTLSEHMFENCTSLESIDTTSIKNYNQDCLKGSGINSLTIPTGSKLQMYAFEGCPELTSVTIESGVTFESGHTGFFKDCAKLTNVSLASDMTSIPNEMFKNCTSLSSFDFTNIKTINQSAFENTGFETIELPSTITYIGSTAFQLCKKIEKVVINSNLSEGIFKNCASLNDITFGENITSIPSSAFYGCKGLENITIPSTVTTIGHSSFRACGLTELIIPSTVTSVDAYAFEGNTKLTKLIINGICDADSAFYNCTSLKEVTIAEGNEKITSDMFWNCISLTTINLPDSLTTIDYRAFKNCVSLTSFTVPENVTSISSSSLGLAFDGCVNLIEIYNLSSLSITLGEKEANGGIGYYAKTIHTSKDESSSIVTDSNGYSFMYVDNKGYLIGYNGNNDELVLPESFEYNGNTISEYEIKPYSFYNNQNIKSIIISDSVTSIGEYAFYSCEELVNVVIGNNVKAISEDAFYNCNKLIEVVMGNTVKTIGINAFYSCSSLLSITIPASVESIGSGAFSFCYRLAEIYNLSSISIVKGVSDNSNGNIAQYALIVHTSSGDKSVLVIDNGYVFAYIESENLGYVVGYIGNKDSIVIPGSFTYNGNTITNLKIKEAAFYYRSDLKSIIISDGINALGRNAFYGTSIDYLEVADGVEIDGYKPFQNAKIVKAKVPYNLVGQISTNYASTSGLTEVIITCSETNKELANSALYGCTSLVSIVIPKEITYINYNAFARCSSLKNVYLEKAPNETMNYDEYGNSYYTDATKYYYSEEEPTDTTNLYWHYVDGEPTPW